MKRTVRTAYLGDRTIGLDGVPAQQANYAKMGFVPAYETIRMRGTLPHSSSRHQTLPVGHLDDIRDLDRQCFPASRDAFLRLLSWPFSARGEPSWVFHSMTQQRQEGRPGIPASR